VVIHLQGSMELNVAGGLASLIVLFMGVPDRWGKGRLLSWLQHTDYHRVEWLSPRPNFTPYRH